MRVRIKSKRHCKRYNKISFHGICNDYWLSLAGEVVDATQILRGSYDIHPTKAQQQRRVLPLYILKTAIAKRFKA